MDAVGGIERMIKATKASGSLNIANGGLTYTFLRALAALVARPARCHLVP